MRDKIFGSDIQIRRPRLLGAVRMLVSAIFDFSPTRKIDAQVRLRDLTDPSKLTITYIGHATLFINFFGTTILTDPVFSNRIGLIVKRKISPGLPIAALPQVNFVIISHAHLDHLNRPSLRRLAQKTETLIIPKNCTDLVKDLGFKHIIEKHWESEISPLAVSEQAGEGQFKIISFRPQHWGARWPWENVRRGYNSYILKKNGVNILFAGDTGYSPIFAQISQKFPIDIACLPITAYNPPEFRLMHMHPEDAVMAFRDIKAKYLIPIHWGVFRLSFEPLPEPPRLIADKMEYPGQKQKLALLAPGVLWTYPHFLKNID